MGLATKQAETAGYKNRTPGNGTLRKLSIARCATNLHVNPQSCIAHPSQQPPKPFKKRIPEPLEQTQDTFNTGVASNPNNAKNTKAK